MHRYFECCCDPAEFARRDLNVIVLFVLFNAHIHIMYLQVPSTHIFSLLINNTLQSLHDAVHAAARRARREPDSAELHSGSLLLLLLF